MSMMGTNINLAVDLVDGIIHTDADTSVYARKNFSKNLYNHFLGNPARKPVDKMDYMLLLCDQNGNVSDVIADSMGTVIASNGVYIETISWGIQSSYADGTVLATLDVTAHDIGGKMFETFLKMKKKNTYIQFYAPTTSFENENGFDMFSEPITYWIKESSVSFSQIRGFTYSFTGVELGTTSANNLLSASSTDCNINQSEKNGWTDKGLHLKGFIETLVTHHNDQKVIKNNPNRAIFVDFSVEYGGSYWETLYPFGNTSIKNNGTMNRIENFKIKEDESMATTIIRAFNDLYVDVDLKSRLNPQIQCVLKDSDDNGVYYFLTIVDTQTSNNVNTNIVFWVGDDSTAWDVTNSPNVFRADIEDINYDDMLSFLLMSQDHHTGIGGDISKSQMGDGTQEVSIVTAVSTNELGNPIGVNSENYSATGNSISDEAIGNDYNAATSTNKIDKEGLNKHSSRDEFMKIHQNLAGNPFSITLKMPYTSALHLDNMGSNTLLASACSDGRLKMINLNQGAVLEFYWYDDYTSHNTTLHPLSGMYRFKSVQHTIGSTNSTIVNLTALGTTGKGSGNNNAGI